MKKSILSIMLVFLLTSCMESAAVLSGPTLALGKTSNDVQSSFALGASYGLKKVTGKTFGVNHINIVFPSKMIRDSSSKIISKCKGSCGCTVPECPKEPILPGESGLIKVNYDEKRVGSFNKSITIVQSR